MRTGYFFACILKSDPVMPTMLGVATMCCLLVIDDYLAMMDKGLTTADFARKYRLTDQQMRRFLDMVRTEVTTS